MAGWNDLPRKTTDRILEHIGWGLIIDYRKMLDHFFDHGKLPSPDTTHPLRIYLSLIRVNRSFYQVFRHVFNYGLKATLFAFLRDTQLSGIVKYCEQAERECLYVTSGNLSQLCSVLGKFWVNRLLIKDEKIFPSLLGAQSPLEPLDKIRLLLYLEPWLLKHAN